MSDGFPINASKERMGLNDFYRQSMLLRDDEAKCFRVSESKTKYEHSGHLTVEQDPPLHGSNGHRRGMRGGFSNQLSSYMCRVCFRSRKAGSQRAIQT